MEFLLESTQASLRNFGPDSRYWSGRSWLRLTTDLFVPGVLERLEASLDGRLFRSSRERLRTRTIYFRSFYGFGHLLFRRKNSETLAFSSQIHSSLADQSDKSMNEDLIFVWPLLTTYRYRTFLRFSTSGVFLVIPADPKFQIRKFYFCWLVLILEIGLILNPI